MQQLSLKKLLNDESFIRWIKDEATDREQKKWDHWLNDNPERQFIVRKAKKIMTMPFIENIPFDLEGELNDLMDEIEKLSS